LILTYPLVQYVLVVGGATEAQFSAVGHHRSATLHPGTRCAATLWEETAVQRAIRGGNSRFLFATLARFSCDPEKIRHLLFEGEDDCRCHFDLKFLNLVPPDRMNRDYPWHLNLEPITDSAGDDLRGPIDSLARSDADSDPLAVELSPSGHAAASSVGKIASHGNGTGSPHAGLFSADDAPPEQPCELGAGFPYHLMKNLHEGLDPCVVQVGADDRLVPSEIINSWSPTSDCPEGERDMHRYAIFSDRCETQIDRKIGHYLRRLKDMDGFAKLGYARIADYAKERLGQSIRWTQERIRLDRALSRLPVLSEAHATSRLTTWQVLALLPIATPENERSWLERSRSMSVRALKWAVRDAVADRIHATREAAKIAKTTSCGGTETTNDAVQRDQASGDKPFKSIPAALTTPADDANPERLDDFVENDYWIQFKTPAAVAHLHDLTIELVRKAAGANEPLDRCVEYILAEFIAGTSPVDPISREYDWATREQLDPLPPPKHTGSPFDEKQDDREKACEVTTRNWWFISDPPEQFVLDPDLIDDSDTDDPVTLDHRIMRLMRFRQIRHGEMAMVLGEIHGRRLWKELGFASFNHYCKLTGQSPHAVRDSYERRSGSFF